MLLIKTSEGTTYQILLIYIYLFFSGRKGLEGNAGKAILGVTQGKNKSQAWLKMWMALFD